MMFNLDTPNDFCQENLSSLDFENNWVSTDGPTVGRTDPRTDSGDVSKNEKTRYD